MRLCFVIQCFRWNGFSQRDAALIERMAMARHFGRRGFLQSEHERRRGHPSPQQTYMSEWPLSGETLWTIVNRGASDISGPQLSVAATIQSKLSSLETEAAPMVLRDCMHGRHAAERAGRAELHD